MSVITVSQLNNYMKRYIDNNQHLNELYIKGEISNFKLHTSGHIYMTLKDSGSTLKCVMFSSYTTNLKFRPEYGMKVIAFGRISVYERDGAYQLYVENLIPDGVGELYAAFEQLKLTLEQKGYFASEIKKPIPSFPSSIGVVTSKEGAAVKDVLSVLKRRCPMTKVYIYPALVQGVGAAKSVSEGIDYFNKEMMCDTIIVTRGGGSIEDLWAFNELSVAESIHRSKIPVISAIGHETDFTISDFVSDLRAPTPSVAAELAVPDCEELYMMIKNHSQKLTSILKNYITLKKQSLQNALDSDIYKIITDLINNRKILIDSYSDEMNEGFTHLLQNKRHEFSSLCGKLEALSPLKVISRGYSVVKCNDKIVSSVNHVKADDNIDITVTDGTISCVVLDS